MSVVTKNNPEETEEEFVARIETDATHVVNYLQFKKVKAAKRKKIDAVISDFLSYMSATHNAKLTISNHQLKKG